MPRAQFPGVAPKRKAWNKGRIIGQKRPLLPKQVWAIRAGLELAGNLRDSALFNEAIDSKLRGCDLVKLAVTELVKDDLVTERVSVIQSKTKRPVQFDLSENTRDTVLAWVHSPEMFACRRRRLAVHYLSCLSCAMRRARSTYARTMSHWFVLSNENEASFEQNLSDRRHLSIPVWLILAFVWGRVSRAVGRGI